MDVDVAIVGAGMTGLTCAHRLLSDGRRVIVLESSSRVGGNVWTERGDDFVRECGPNAFGENSEPMLRLVRELALESRLVHAPDYSGRRFLYVRGRLRRVPSNPVAFLASSVLPLGARLRLLREPFVSQRPADAPEETLAQFCDRRLGRALRTGLVTPVVSGITAGDPERLSAESAFPRMVAMERDHGSLLRGAFAGGRPPSRGRLTSFDLGLGTLTDALATRIGDALRRESPVTAITRDAGGFAVECGSSFHARAVVIATPSRAAAALLQSVSPAAATALTGIDAPPLVVAHALLERSESLPDAFGFLAPRDQGLRILGAIFGSRLFPGRAPPGMDVVTVFLGGAIDRAVTSLTDDELRRLVVDDLARALPGAPCRDVRLHRWSESIPQYELGHARRIATLDAALATVPGLHAIGAYRDGISLPDRVTAGETTAQRILEALAS